MVKLNFKKSTPLVDDSVDTEKPEKSEISEQQIASSSDVTEIQLQGEEDVSASIEADQQISTTPAEQKQSSVKKESGPKEMRFREDTLQGAPDKPDSESGGNFKKVLLIAVIVLIVLIIGFGSLYQFTDIFKKSTTVKIETESPVTPPKNEEEAVPAPQTTPLISAWQKNLGINQFMHGHLSQILSEKGNFIRISLLVITPGEINLTVLSDSDDKIAGFKNDLNQAFQGLNFRTISSNIKRVNRTDFVFADLTSKVQSDQIRSPDIIPAASSVSAAPKNDISSLIKKYKLTQDYFRSGQTQKTSGFAETNFYLEISGKRDALLSFLKDIAIDHPSLRILKIAINPTNLITYSDNMLTARLNILYIGSN